MDQPAQTTTALPAPTAATTGELPACPGVRTAAGVAACAGIEGQFGSAAPGPIRASCTPPGAPPDNPLRRASG